MDIVYRLRRVAAAGLLVSLLGGCATIVSGASQSVTIVTDPSGAECRLDRGGSSLAVVNPTPGTVHIDKSKDAITVRCSKEGFQESVGSLSSEFQGMTFGNIIFGGIIGVGVDAASGAMNQYPAQVTILLVPGSFRSTGERDAFFDAVVQRAQARTEIAVKKMRDQCAAGDGCDSEVKRLRTLGDQEVSRLEDQRLVARIES